MIFSTRRGFGAVLAGAFVLSVAACGGGGGAKAPVEKTVSGPHFVFAAPGDWTATKTAHGILVAPKKEASELVSVSTFPTVKVYRPSLFEKAIPEIDRAAAQYAQQLGGSVASSATVYLAGRKGRQYVVEQGKLHERISFVFRNRTEYFLVCQWHGSTEPAACARLTATFRLS